MLTVRARRIVRFPDEMGIFLTTIGVESPRGRGNVRFVENALVDTGSEFTWIPTSVLEELGIERERVEHFVMADGTPVTRDCGYAIVHADRRSTSDDVVFALPSDTAILGARSIEGLNFRVDLMNKRFLHAGPRPVATA
ncbi:MAG: hypothetical protein ACT4R6_04300 [Gemmatimonadaceae bacterium]